MRHSVTLELTKETWCLQDHDGESEEDLQHMRAESAAQAWAQSRPSTVSSNGTENAEAPTQASSTKKETDIKPLAQMSLEELEQELQRRKAAKSTTAGS